MINFMMDNVLGITFFPLLCAHASIQKLILDRPPITWNMEDGWAGIFGDGADDAELMTLMMLRGADKGEHGNHFQPGQARAWWLGPTCWSQRSDDVL